MAGSEVFSSLTVLVVDDEEFATNMARRMLGILGVGKLLFATSGSEALQLLKETDETVDLIFCDIVMTGMNGYEFAHRIRDGEVPELEDVPIIMMTGVGTKESLQRERLPKVDGYLKKFPKIDVLFDTMKEALRR